MNGMTKIMNVGNVIVTEEGRGSESICKGGWRGIAIHGLFDREKGLAILAQLPSSKQGLCLVGT